MCFYIRLEIENARLEATAKQQSNKIDALQKGAQETAMVSPTNPCRLPAHTVLDRILKVLCLFFEQKKNENA